MPKLSIKTRVTSSVVSVFLDSKTGLYDVTISNCEGTHREYVIMGTNLRMKCKVSFLSLAPKLCHTLRNSLNKDMNNFPTVLNDVR